MKLNAKDKSRLGTNTRDFNNIVTSIKDDIIELTYDVKDKHIKSIIELKGVKDYEELIDKIKMENLAMLHQLELRIDEE